MSAEPRFGTGQRVLLACTGGVSALRPVLEDRRAASPGAEFTLLVPAGERQNVPVWASEVLAPDSFWTADLIGQLQGRHFGAAVILTAPGDSPHGLGYLCALAGIPERVGASTEFGGQTLTEWIRPDARPLPHPLPPDPHSPTERS